MKQNSESKEMYLEVIYDLQKDNEDVHSVDVAKKLGYTKPSIARAISVLKKEKYIHQEPYGPISLTKKGLKTAESIKNKHINLTKFLSMSLNLSKEDVEEDACRIEHIISEKTMNAIEKYIEDNN